MRIAAAIVLLFLCSPALAQVEQIEARVGSVTCGTCFNSAMVTLKQVPGVADVAGDVKDGWIRVSVNPKKGVSIKEVLDRVRVAGENSRFTITASGRLEQRGNRMVLVVPNQKEVLLVDAGDRERMAMNAATSGDSMRATGEIWGSGNQYDLKIQKLQKQ